MVQSFGPARPCPEMLGMLRSRFPNAATYPVQLESATMISGSTNDSYECLICQNIVWDVTSCKGCDKLFCSGCIKTWLQRDRSCPHCRACFDADKISRVVLRELELMKFKCSVCQQPYAYNQAGQHQSSCSAPKIACLLGCSP